MFLLFLLIWKDKSFAYIPLKKKGSKSCSSPQKFCFVSWIDFRSLKMFWRGQEAERRRRVKM